MTLAYVFWHWKQVQVAAHEYERRQRQFHQALSDAPPPGYVRSFSFGIVGAPWAADGSDAYEDWYLVRDFAALGTLNDAAISQSRRGPHDAAASLAKAGTAALYGLRCGTALPEPACVYWFGKPAGMGYAAAFAQLAPLVEQADAALWMRQMTLGPALEFCLHAPAPLALPGSFDALYMQLRPAWPKPRDS